MPLVVAPTSQESVFGTALLIAAALHALLILGVGLQHPVPTATARPPTLDVVLVNHLEPRPADTVTRPDFLAQEQVQGGGDQPIQQTTPRVADTPLTPTVEALPQETPSTEPPLPPAAPAVPDAQGPSAPAEPAHRVAEARVKPAEPVVAPPKAATARTRVTAAQILASRGEEISQVTAQLDKKVDAYANRERHKAISASTQEYKYAAYLDAWRSKVERVGNLNYPEEARRRKLYGNVVLHVAVRADGSVDGVHVVQSSGSRVLDEAAIHIVRLAAPFAPLPPDIRAETDVLDITRTWQFLSSNRLGWGK